MPHATEQLGLWATTAEPAFWSPWATTTEPAYHNYWSPPTWSPCSSTGEATAMRSRCTASNRGPHSPQLEKAHMQQQRPNTAKNRLINQLKKKHKKQQINQPGLKTIYPYFEDSDLCLLLTLFPQASLKYCIFPQHSSLLPPLRAISLHTAYSPFIMFHIHPFIFKNLFI